MICYYRCQKAEDTSPSVILLPPYHSSEMRIDGDGNVRSFLLLLRRHHSFVIMMGDGWGEER